MKLLVPLAASILGLTSLTFAQNTPSLADSAAIMAAIANWERAWETHDVELAARDYAEDADWTNAFGMRRLGRDSLQALLTQVFELPFVMAGHTEMSTTIYDFSVRMWPCFEADPYELASSCRMVACRSRAGSIISVCSPSATDDG